MRTYFSFFKVRFFEKLQYRMASLSALTTQLIWGMMECFAYKAILESTNMTPPMELLAIVSYIWLKEAFLALFNTWAADNDIFGMITDGGIAYELCRPVSVYKMWYARNIGGRMAEALLRCIPVLIGAFLIPAPFKLSLPVNTEAFFLFVLTMILGLGVTVSFCMLVYILCFFTISPQGGRMLFMGAVEFLSGSTIPLPFIPQPFRGFIELLPFASMNNVPFRIYSGHLAGNEMLRAIGLQIFWLCALTVIGQLVCKKAERRVVVQGG